MLQHADYSESGIEEHDISLPLLPHLIYIRATIKELSVPLIPFALLKTNPITTFQESLAVYRKAAGAEHISVATLRDAWNELFADLRPEQEFFLHAWSSVPHASAQVIRTAGLTFSIGTAGPLNRRWFITRPTWRKGELVAWCQVIDMRAIRPEQVTLITLSEERMIRLQPALLVM